MLLALDVGNTSCGAVLFDATGRAVARRRTPTPAVATRSFLDRLLPAARNRRALTGVVVSSVVPRLDREVGGYLKRETGIRPLFVSHLLDCGLRWEIDKPAQLGADRIADCVGALQLFPPPLMVIDSGTATTFDLVTAGRAYVGGCILPGFEISLRALAEKAAKLRYVRFAVPERSVGRNTADCIRSGIFYGHIGALEYLIGEYRRVLGARATVVATGGLSRMLRNRLRGVDAWNPDLIYVGMRAIHERNR